MSSPGDVNRTESRNHQAVRPPVASLLEISEAMRAQEVPPVDWMGGGFPGGWGGGRCEDFFWQTWQLMNFFFFFCVFFFSWWTLCHGWQILFIFCNLCILFVFFPFTVRMGNFCASHFVRLDLSWRWDVFLLFWSCWITFLMSMKMFRKTVLIFPFFFRGVKKVIRTFAVPLRLNQKKHPHCQMVWICKPNKVGLRVW